MINKLTASQLPASQIRRLWIFGFEALIACLVLLPVATQWLVGNPWILNNEHLAPFDYVSQLISGKIAWTEVTHARIPSFWPDYAFAFVALTLAGWTVKAFAFYWFLQFFSSVLGLSLLGLLFPGRRGVLLSGFSLTALVVLVYASSQFRDLIFQSGIPARHGGSWLNFCVLVLLFGFLNSSAISKGFFWFGRVLLLVLSMVGVFSNRLLLIQFVLPLGLLLLALMLLRRLKGFSSPNKSLHGSYVWILIGSLLGYLQYILSFHQCSEMGVKSVSAISTLLAMGRVSSDYLQSLPFLLLVFGFLFLVLGIVGFFRSGARCVLDSPLGTPRLPALLMFVGLVVMLGVFAYFQLGLDLLNRAYWRYLIVPAYVCLFGVGLLLVSLIGLLPLGHYYSVERGLRIQSFWGSFTLVAATLLLGGWTLNCVESVSKAYLGVYGRQDSWLDSALERSSLSGALGFAADPPWESRRLSIVSSGHIRTLSVSSDGNPLIYPHSRIQFVISSPNIDVMNPSPAEVVAPSYILASPKDFDRMKGKYGEPLRKLGCFESKGCMYQFDSSKINANTSTFLSTYRSDRYRCLESYLIKLRSGFVYLLRRLQFIAL